MAWLDDRVWCHPKVVQVSDKAFRVWVASICYSAGFQLRGTLAPGHQAAIGSTPKVRNELIAYGLWTDGDKGSVEIHDWAAHNDRRDAERAANRERKRRQRLRDTPVTNGVTSTVTHGVTRTVTAHCEGSEGSEGSDIEALGLSLVREMP